MRNTCLTIARKEVIDAWRDRRSLISAMMYAAMGPGVAALTALAVRGSKPAAVHAMMAGLISVFTLVSMFSGGMNVAMDTIAGERERRTLLPLLCNPVTRAEVIVGKWLGVGAFAAAGLAVNLLGFAIVLRVSPASPPGSGVGLLALLFLFGLAPLALFAAALELLVSTACRAIKEAHTYLSWLVFLPTGVGMLLAFTPHPSWWWRCLPMAGQQLELSAWLSGGEMSWARPVLLGVCTLFSTALLLWMATRQLEREDAVFGS
jgi:sodium transport system permease protein